MQVSGLLKFCVHQIVRCQYSITNFIMKQKFKSDYTSNVLILRNNTYFLHIISLFYCISHQIIFQWHDKRMNILPNSRLI